MDKLSNALSAETRKKWDAFRAASNARNVPVPEDPEFVAELKTVFSYSDFVAGHLTRNPQLLGSLIESADLFNPYRPQAFRAKLDRALDGLDGRDPDAALAKVLRRTRLREMVRIAWRDLSGRSDLSETLADLSGLADACLTAALSVLHARLCAEFGVPFGAGGVEQGLVVVAMGKLGGRELNFSSDIDLIFAYPEPGETRGPQGSVGNEAFFTRLCRRLINVIGAATPEGIVFRVDLRLRPFGESGPLVTDFDALESYLQMHGREWERYAWIKARIAAGDRAAGQRLLERLKPFVYRRHLDFGAFESLRDMKQKILLETRRKGMENDIKLGAGGIREVEFFAQTFQLIRGGVEPALQRRSTRSALRSLAGEGFIDQGVCDELIRAYEFLRITENRLQEFSDLQTHRLPTASVERERLAASAGFDSWETFADVLNRQREIVNRHFNGLLYPRSPDQPDRTGREPENRLQSVWLGLLDEEAANEALSDSGYESPEAVLRILENLRSDPATLSLTVNGRNRLDKLLPTLIRITGARPEATQVLRRILDLIKAVEQRTCYLALLLENPSALEHLVGLAEASPWVVSFLARHPVLLDELLDPRTLYNPPQRPALESDVRRRLGRAPGDDLEQQIQELCIFKQVNTLRVAAADVTGALTLMKTSDHLTDIAETILNQVLDLAWEHLVKKHGKPECLQNKTGDERGFSVVAYGKLGGIELGYDSDLDLVFLHAGTGSRNRSGIDDAQFFARLGQRVIHLLTARTRAGMLYETDMRLRPSGSSGVLVSHIDAFADYQFQKARTWEHQALVRARPISGDAHLARRFEKTRKIVLARPRIPEVLQGEVVGMREKMRKAHLRPAAGVFDLKQGRGGIVDIEFLVQYLVLLESAEHGELLRWTDNVRILETLAETGTLDGETARRLRLAYLDFRQAVHRLSLQKKPARVGADHFRDHRKNVRRAWQALLGRPETGA